MSDLDAVREQVGAEHGLPPAAIKFVTGETIEDIEGSADRLAKLLDTASARADDEPTNLLDAARRGQAERKAALLASLSGRRAQARDSRGRYAPAGSFDGGPRRALPTRRDAEVEHCELVGDLAAQSHHHGVADVGRLL